MTTGADKEPVDKMALEHAWDWFEYHANQRMTMVRFYLIAVGGIGAGVGFLLSAHENLLGAMVSVGGVITSLCFKNLDRRVSHLVKIGEDALKPEQLKIGAALDSPAFQICRIAGEKPIKSRLYTYGENFRFLFNTLMAAFSVTTIISIVRAIMPYAVYLCRAGHS